MGSRGVKEKVLTVVGGAKGWWRGKMGREEQTISEWVVRDSRVGGRGFGGG